MDFCVLMCGCVHMSTVTHGGQRHWVPKLQAAVGVWTEPSPLYEQCALLTAAPPLQALVHLPLTGVKAKLTSSKHLSSISAEGVCQPLSPAPTGVCPHRGSEQ